MKICPTQRRWQIAWHWIFIDKCCLFKGNNNSWIFSSHKEVSGVARVEKVHSNSHKSDPKPDISNSLLQLLCLVGNSFPFFLICSPVGFISIRFFKFKMELMIKEPSCFFPCEILQFKVFGDVSYSWQDLLYASIEIIQLHCFRCSVLVPLLVITSEVINLL